MRLTHRALVTHQSGLIQIVLTSPVALVDLFSPEQQVAKQPDRFLVWNGIGPHQPQKLLEREPVVYLVLRLLIREIVVSRQHEPALFMKVRRPPPHPSPYYGEGEGGDARRALGDVKP